MKFLTLIFALITGTACAQYTGDTWKQASAGSKGTISLAYVETPSFAYMQNGKLTGICVDLMNDFTTWVKDNKKVEIESKFVGDGTSFRGTYDKVKASKGGVFGLGNITITDERKREVKFTSPFITNFAILITQNTVPTLAKLEDMPATFKGLTAYSAKGTLNEKRMRDLKSKYFPDLPVTATTTSQETLEKVFTDPKSVAYLDLRSTWKPCSSRRASSVTLWQIRQPSSSALSCPMAVTGLPCSKNLSRPAILTLRPTRIYWLSTSVKRA